LGLGERCGTKPNSVAVLPYIQTTFGRPTIQFASYNIGNTDLPPRKISTFLRSVKDDLGLKTPGVYSIPCVCGQVYIGQTSSSFETRIKEHHHIRLAQPEKSAVAEHRTSQDHVIKFQETKIIATKSGYLGHIIREAIGLELYHNNMNRQDGQILTKQ
jgi:hypothetical protein